MSVLHRPLDLSAIPDEVTAARPEASRFSASWPRTERHLLAEAGHLAGKNPARVDVFVEVDVPPSAIRLDGGIKAGARPPASHVVAVTVPHRELGELRLVSGRYVGTGGQGYLVDIGTARVTSPAIILGAVRAAITTLENPDHA